MVHRKSITVLTVVACLLLFAVSSQAAPIPGTAGVATWQDGPNAEGLYYIVTVNYEAFDGLDASDPLGVTPGKTQYAYIMDYVEGNEYVGRFDVESTNGVPLLDVTTSTNGTVNGVTPGTDSPEVTGIATYADGNPAARFLYTDAGDAYFGLAGDRSVIMVYTASNTYSVDMVLAQITNSSLSAAGEVTGPTVCNTTITGTVSCSSNDPNNTPIAGVTVNLLQDSNQVTSTVTGANGQYQFTGMAAGQYTVAINTPTGYVDCSATSVDVSVACNVSTTANFCVCPQPQTCTQQITVQTICDQNGTAVPVAAWIGISGPNVCTWTSTGTTGVKTFTGAAIVPGHYKVKVVAPKGYQITGSDTQEFDLAACGSQQVVFNVCLIPPCVQTICVSVVDNNSIPIPNINICVACFPVDRKCGTTGTNGTACFNLTVGTHTATIDVPNGYKLYSNSNTIPFSLARCESKSIQFVLYKIPLKPCPRHFGYWRCNPGRWPYSTMWIGSCQFNQTQIMNILNGKKPNGANASSDDISMTLAQTLIAAKLSIAAGADVADIETSVTAADEFLLYDNPPGSRPQGKNADLARKLNNHLYDYIQGCTYCQP